MLTRALLSTLAAFMLSGCWWIGPAFYSPDPANAGPFEPGLYKVDTLGDHKPAERIRIARAADGTTIVTNPAQAAGSPEEMIFARLPLPGRTIWIAQWRSGGSTEEGRGFGLVEQRGNLVAANVPLVCQGNEALVRGAGGSVTGEDEVDIDGNKVGKLAGPTCGFTDKASLERALLAYVTAHPGFDANMRIKRVGD
ncbi:MAG: hypothetical protein ABIS51_03055 [Sphingomonas sp.]